MPITAMTGIPKSCIGAWQMAHRVLAIKVANGDKYADSIHIGDISWLPKQVAFE
jgi:hypothetical protein